MRVVGSNQVLGVHRRRWMRSHDRIKGIPPSCCRLSMKIKVGVESYFSGGISGVELFLHLRLLLVKLTNALNHFIKNLSRNPMIQNLKETPGLTCIPNFLYDFRTASWVGMDAFHVYDGNLERTSGL
nr:hypothetical protein Iba_scaffold21028CG0160 [Ipomoea batatas]